MVEAAGSEGEFGVVPAPGSGPNQQAVVLEGGGPVIAAALHRAAGFLARVRDVHGLPVSARTMDLTQLVVSELFANAYK